MITRYLRSLYVLLFVGISTLTFQSCTTYYHAHEQFNQAFQTGQFKQCEDWLKKHSPKKNAKDKFLYYTNLGLVQFLQNETEASNQSFEKAFLLVEDFENKPGEYAASFLVNPNQITYTGERYERLFINYFKALNQLKVNDPESTLIEARRLIRKLNVLEEGSKNKSYHTDGFIFWVIGMLFEAGREPENAFIYYKKAQEAYHQSFVGLCNLSEPGQLSKDLVRAAYAAGFDSDAQHFENQLHVANENRSKGTGTAVILWHKGLGPIKDESRITFNVVKGVGGGVSFSNAEHGFSLPLLWPVNEPADPNRLDNVQFITMALPKYIARPTYWNQMSLNAFGKSYDFQLATNLYEVAKADLNDRLAATLATALARVAIKEAIRQAATKATENAVENKSPKDDARTKQKKQQQADFVSSLVNQTLMIINAATEKADTRNWQTLPEKIEVLRLDLPSGKQTLTLNGTSISGKTFSQALDLEIVEGQTIFHTVQTF